MNIKLITKFYEKFHPLYRDRIDKAVSAIVKSKEENKNVVVVTGSGPNIHEGVTTLIAELIRKDIIDGVLTSSAVIAHEMAGALDKVKRVNAGEIGNTLNDGIALPKGDIFELSQLTHNQWEEIQNEMNLDKNLVDALREATGKTIIKAAGNMAYPMG
ncbi:MAG: hypothetical protein GF364_06465, partial [Candidatus Lokiarchaeota archaeon]|nr:hypothetical protein [Candidatus Lokiarchaeota archaeon]